MRTLLRSLPLPFFLALGGAFDHGLWYTSSFPQKSETRVAKVTSSGCLQDINLSLQSCWYFELWRPLAVVWKGSMCNKTVPVTTTIELLPISYMKVRCWDALELRWTKGFMANINKVFKYHWRAGWELYGCLDLLSFFGTFVLKISNATMLLVGHPCSKARANTKPKWFGRFKSYWYVSNLGSLKSPRNNGFGSGNQFLSMFFRDPWSSCQMHRNWTAPGPDDQRESGPVVSTITCFVSSEVTMIFGHVGHGENKPPTKWWSSDSWTRVPILLSNTHTYIYIYMYKYRKIIMTNLNCWYMFTPWSPWPL